MSIGPHVILAGLFPLLGVALICKQIKQGYVIGGNWKPWFYRDRQPLGFWAVIAWCVLWTLLATAFATFGLFIR